MTQAAEPPRSGVDGKESKRAMNPCTCGRLSEALTLYLDRKRPKLTSLNHFARMCRVENVMRPYIEAQL